MGIPIELPAEQIFISLFPETEGHGAGEEQHYAGNIRIQVPSAIQARALITIFTLARGFISFDDSGGIGMLAAILFSNPPVQDEGNLNIKTPALSVGDISLLFDLFSL